MVPEFPMGCAHPRAGSNQSYKVFERGYLTRCCRSLLWITQEEDKTRRSFHMASLLVRHVHQKLYECKSKAVLVVFGR
jgi:hypothetical protein